MLPPLIPAQGGKALLEVSQGQETSNGGRGRQWQQPWQGWYVDRPGPPWGAHVTSVSEPVPLGTQALRAIQPWHLLWTSDAQPGCDSP